MLQRSLPKIERPCDRLIAEEVKPRFRRFLLISDPDGVLLFDREWAACTSEEASLDFRALDASRAKNPNSATTFQRSQTHLSFPSTLSLDSLMLDTPTRRSSPSPEPGQEDDPIIGLIRVFHQFGRDIAQEDVQRVTFAVPVSAKESGILKSAIYSKYRRWMLFHRIPGSAILTCILDNEKVASQLPNTADTICRILMQVLNALERWVDTLTTITAAV